MKAHHLFAAAALAAFLLPAAAQGLKPGLWEITSKVGGNPEMEQAMAQMRQQMASMSPAQRKQAEEMMAKQGVHMGAGGAGGMAVRMCLTQEMVDRNEIGASQGDCKTTSQARSGNTMKMAFTCTHPPSTGEGEVTFTSSEAYRSRVKVVSSQSGKPETMTVEGAGKWLGADCGAVKPVALPKK